MGPRNGRYKPISFYTAAIPPQTADCLASVFRLQGCILGDPSVVQTVYFQRSNQCLRALTLFFLREEDPEKSLSQLLSKKIGTFNTMPARSAPQTSDLAVFWFLAYGGPVEPEIVFRDWLH